MKKTALDIIRYINQEIENSTLSPDAVLYDMHMLGFKVKTHLGGTTHLQAPKHEVIHAIWKLIKADSIISEEIDELDEVDQDAVLAYFHSMEVQLNHTLDHMIETTFDSPYPSKRVKFEIFKDFLSEKQVN